MLKVWQILSDGFSIARCHAPREEVPTMRMITFIVLSGPLLLGLNAAAQTATDAASFRGAFALRVQTSFQASTSLAPGSTMADQTRTGEAARRLIYEAAARECDLLTDVFHADCRVSALVANNTVQERGNVQTVVATANATYELTGVRAAAPRQ
jgi:hypothetical protein